MSAEEIARRFDDIPGHDLIDYAEVGLPIFRLLIDAVTMVRKPLSPIAEFVLRAIEAGLRRHEQVATFLGLERTIVEGALSLLKSDGLVVERLGNNEAEPAYDLTESGREVLRESAQYRPQDQTLTVDYDGIVGKPVWVEGEALSQSHHLALRNAIEIHPYPADPPKVADLDLAEIKSVIAKQFRGRDDGSFDILALKRVSRVVRLFRPAVGLAYRMRATKDVRIIFVVDGTRNEDLERAFAEKNGPRKMRIVQSVDESDMQAKIRRRLGKEIVERLPKEDEVRVLRRSLSLGKLREDANRKKAERATTPEEREKAEAAALQARTEAEEAANALRELPARQMAVYEQREMLGRALQSATKRFWVSSTSVRDSILTPTFLRRLNELLANDVEVRFALTLDPDRWGQNRNEKNAFEQLQSLSRRRRNLHIQHRPKADGLHYMLVDDAVAIISNQPFLGNLAKVRNFVHVHGIVLRGPDLVNPLYSRLDLAPEAV